MAQYPVLPSRENYHHLKDKVVVLSGGASGIGAAIATLLYDHGAKVVLGDINVDAGEALIEHLYQRSPRPTPGSPSSSVERISLVLCDVCSYGHIYGLFRTAHDRYGRVDHAVFCAGIIDSATSSYFDATLTIDTVAQDLGDTRTLDVNFLGACAFARIAVPFLRQSTDAESNGPSSSDNGQQRISNRSLTFLSSVTGFRDAPGMFLYQTSKQAMLGLMRAMRTAIYQRDGIRVNAVCPGMTETPMTSATGLIDLFKNRPEMTSVNTSASASLPSHYQSSAAVAEHIAAIILAEHLNGTSIYVEEGKGWDLEEGLAREMPQWLGEEPTRLSNDNLKFLQSLGGI